MNLEEHERVFGKHTVSHNVDIESLARLGKGGVRIETYAPPHAICADEKWLFAPKVLWNSLQTPEMAPTVIYLIEHLEILAFYLDCYYISTNFLVKFPHVDSPDKSLIICLATTFVKKDEIDKIRYRVTCTES